MTMTERQAYALAHPTTDPTTVVTDKGLARVRRHPRGLWVRSILAVDR